MNTLLLVGDTEDNYAFKKLKGLDKPNIKISYDDILNNNLPEIDGDISVFLFFPMKYWDEHIEGQYYEGVYGNYTFYIKFERFWENINQLLHEKYFYNNLHFINNPLRLALCRDKAKMKQLLSHWKISVPKTYYARKYKLILKLLDSGKKLFVKARCGSMGKGITYLEKDKWLSNLEFFDDSIVSRKSDEGWTFHDLSNNLNFLKELFKTDIIIEENIDTISVDGKKFDLRILVYGDEVLYMYPRVNDFDKVTTNISQGGHRETMAFLDIPVDVIDKIKKTALKSVKVLGLTFAGVDVLISDNLEFYVVEVNAFPGFPPNFVKILSYKMFS